MSAWIARAELAEALGMSLDAVKKASMRQGWETRLARGPSGREVQVKVASLPLEARARLARARAPYSIDARPPVGGQAFAGATPEQQRRALARARVLELWGAALGRARAGAQTAATREFLRSYNRGEQDRQALEDLGRIRSRRSLETWRDKLAAQGLDGLLDRRGRPPGSGAMPEEMKRFVWQCLQATPTNSAANIRRLLPAQFPGQPLPSAATVQRLVARYKKERAETLLMLHQPSKHKRLYQPSLGRADADLTEPNQRWEIDSTRGDIMGRRHSKVIEIVAKGGRRFTLIAVMDVHSRRVTALLEEKGGGHNINLCLIKAIRKMGLPLSIIMDLGKDYQSRAVQGFCAALHIDTPAIPGYSPELKPHIERWFATLQSDLFATLPGYTANRVENRAEIILPRLSKEQIQAEIDLWIERYERRVHGSTGQTPLERGNPPGWQRTTVPEEELRLLLCPEDERAIRQGVIRHAGGRFYSRELAWLDASARVLVRSDPDDAGLLHVFDLKRRYICVAQDMLRLGLTPEQISEERRAHQKVRKLRRAEARETARALDLAALNRKAARLEIAAAPPVDEAPAEEISFPALEAAVQAREAMLHPAPAAGEEPGDPDERPLFMDELERYEWILARLAAGREVEKTDRAFMARFEGTELWRDLGGEAYRQAQMEGKPLVKAM